MLWKKQAMIMWLTSIRLDGSEGAVLDLTDTREKFLRENREWYE